MDMQAEHATRLHHPARPWAMTRIPHTCRAALTACVIRFAA